MGEVYLMEDTRIKGKIILLIGLAFLLIASGTGFFFLVHAHQVATDNANATAVAKTNATATTAAYSAATNTALLKGFTATAVNATATATGFQNLYNNATSGTPALDDPLRDNSKGYSWIEGTNNDGGACTFTGGAYHVSQSNTKYFNYCAASTNFSTIVRGAHACPPSIVYKVYNISRIWASSVLQQLARRLAAREPRRTPLRAGDRGSGCGQITADRGLPAVGEPAGRRHCQGTLLCR